MKTNNTAEWDLLKENPKRLQSGDIILVQSRGLLSRLIRKFTTDKTETLSWASHVAMVYEVTDREVLIIEALSQIEIHPIEYYQKKGSKLIVMRSLPELQEKQQQNIIETANRYYGNKYGYLTLVAHLLDRLLGNRYLFRKLINMENYPICSWLVSWCYWQGAEIAFTDPPDIAQPDDIMDFAQKNRWTIIWKSDT